MFCPKCGTESSSSPRAFEEIGDRSHAVCHPFISSVVVYTAAKLRWLCPLRFSAITEQRICAIRRSGQYAGGCEILELSRMGG
jgi:hypothetical protein